MHAADIAVFRWINGWSPGYQPFYDFLSEATKMGWVRVVLILVVLFLLVKSKSSRVAAILAILSIALTNGICDLLKNSLPMQRPCVELPNVINHGVGFLQSAGTASAHAANMAALACAFFCCYGRWGFIPMILALFTGLSRIYVGVHYPSQVLLGWLVGAGVARLVVQMYRVMKKRYRKTAAAEEPETEPNA